MPIATSSASARPVAVPPPLSRPASAVMPRKLSATPSSTSPLPPRADGQRRLQLERLGERLDAEEREQPGRERHEGGEPGGARLPERRQPEQPERDGQDADEHADERVAEEALAPTGAGVSIAAGISFTVSMPVELVTPTVIGSSSTQSNGTTIVLERRRPSVVGPSTVYGTIASSTLTFAIVRSSGCGFRTMIRISPGENSTRRMSNSSAGGGFVPDEVDERGAARDDGADGEREQQDGHERPQPPAACADRRSAAAGTAPSRPSASSTDARRSPSSRARRTRTGARGT